VNKFRDEENLTANNFQQIIKNETLNHLSGISYYGLRRTKRYIFRIPPRKDTFWALEENAKILQAY
jgi:hypothetical protein